MSNISIDKATGLWKYEPKFTVEDKKRYMTIKERRE